MPPKLTAMLLAALVAHVSAFGSITPSPSPPASLMDLDFLQCDRQCRAEYGFDDRNIVGNTVTKMVGAEEEEEEQKECECMRGAIDLGRAPFAETEYPVEVVIQAENVTFPNAVPFDTKRFWCGEVGAPTIGDFPIFSTPFLCASNGTDSLPATYNMTSQEADEAGLLVLHCGSCAACSNWDDLELIYKQRNDTLQLMTECSKALSISQFGPEPQDVDDFKECLVNIGLPFSDDGRSRPDSPEKSTCMDCWTDNALNTRVLCFVFCKGRAEDPEPKPFEDDACLQCDEYTSGAAFSQCAGLNRRAAGITSGVVRDPSQICPSAFCSGKGDSCLFDK